MELSDRVVSAELLTAGLLIGFGDGKQAIYLGSFLRSVIDQAEEVIPEEPGD